MIVFAAANPCLSKGSDKSIMKGDVPVHLRTFRSNSLSPAPEVITALIGQAPIKNEARLLHTIQFF